MTTSRINRDKYLDIGQRIRLFREKAGISQAELSRKLGFSSPTMLFHIEHGNRKINVLDLFKVAPLLGVPVETLVYNNEIASSEGLSETAHEISSSHLTQGVFDYPFDKDNTSNQDLYFINEKNNILEIK